MTRVSGWGMAAGVLMAVAGMGACVKARAAAPGPSGGPHVEPRRAAERGIWSEWQVVPDGIADGAGRRVFLLVGGHLEAIDVATGAVVWTSLEAVRPLIVEGERLLAATGPIPAAAAAGGVVALDVRDGHVLAAPVPMLKPGAASIGSVRLDGDRLFVHWVVVHRAPLHCGGVYRPPPVVPPPEYGLTTVDLRFGRADVEPALADELPGDVLERARSMGDSSRVSVWRTEGGYAGVLVESAERAPRLLRWDAAGRWLDPVDLPAPPPGHTLSVMATGRHLAMTTFASGTRTPGRFTFHDVKDGRLAADLPGSLACPGAVLLGARVLCVEATPGATVPKWGDIVTPRVLVARDATTGAVVWTHALDPRRDYRCPPLP